MNAISIWFEYALNTISIWFEYDFFGLNTI